MENTGIGRPLPLGVSFNAEEINFSLYSKHAAAVTLRLFSPENSVLLHEISFDPKKNKTGDIWHLSIKKLDTPLYYAYYLEGPKEKPFIYDKNFQILDPYAKEVSTTNEWGRSDPPYHPLGLIVKPKSFDWQNVKSPEIPLCDLIIYEMHVRGFTQSPSSGIVHKGTFLGIIEKIPHLLDLGINAVELLPLQEFNENENQRTNPKTNEPLFNYWGYSTTNFFAPMNRYATKNGPGEVLQEFKSMVRELHRNGIEVILDVVYNHSSEGNELGPVISYKGIENPVYYILNHDYSYSNYTGCGNTFNCNHPVAWELILESLRYWVLEMHVDGFRFDLASILSRGRQGQPLSVAPVIEAISEDPILSKIKLIAEPWDLGMYQVGKFYSQAKRWSEWNGKYRDCIRRFIKGTSGIKGEFITRLCGSEDLYYNRSPLASINFVTVHDGFTLCDLVSYNGKHNEENGEDNKDGISENDSWNCGVEGPTQDTKILALRNKQLRNYHLALMISKGIPLILMGDEYGHTKRGNNNTWCQDNDLNWFLWDQLKERGDFYRFYKLMIQFRKEHKLLKKEQFLTPKDALWHGVEPFKPDWSAQTQFIAFTLLNQETGNDLYIAFNAQLKDVQVHFPNPRKGKKWHLIADTAAKPPGDIFESSKTPEVTLLKRAMESYSALILEAKS